MQRSCSKIVKNYVFTIIILKFIHRVLKIRNTCDAIPRSFPPPPPGEGGSGPGKKKGARPGKSLDFRVAPPQRRQPPALPPFRAVPSAHAGLTSLFGMGRGVAPPRRRRLCFRDPTQQGPRMPGERTSK